MSRGNPAGVGGGCEGGRRRSLGADATKWRQLGNVNVFVNVAFVATISVLCGAKKESRCPNGAVKMVLKLFEKKERKN